MACKLNKIRINQSSFEYEVTGQESPVFVLLSGYGESTKSWKMIRHEIELHGKVFTYNRLGISGSDQATSAQCGKTIISDLRGILKKLGILPPYILVGCMLVYMGSYIQMK